MKLFTKNQKGLCCDDQPGKCPKMVVKNVTASYNGTYMDMEFPVSFNAFQIIYQGLLKEGIDIKSGGGGGSDAGCSFSFGPFKEIEEAELVIRSLQEKLYDVFYNEQNLVRKFDKLKGEYPICQKEDK